jgi:ubiquitin carboxyl-terminal hydrolase 47
VKRPKEEFDDHLTFSERSQIRLEEKAELKRSCEQLGQKIESLKKPEEQIEPDNTKKRVNFTTTTNPNMILTADEAYDLDNDMLFGNGGFELREMEERKDTDAVVRTVQPPKTIDEDDLLDEIQEESHH